MLWLNRENRVVESACTVPKSFGSDAKAVQNAEIHIAHLGVSVAPVNTMLQSQIATTHNHGWKILRVMSRTTPGAVEDNAVIQYRAIVILELVQFVKEVCELFAEESVILGKL